MIRQYQRNPQPPALRFARQLVCLALALLCATALTPTAHAAEIYSNGYGGGRWSAEATWQGGEVPGPSDTVVISGRDTVIFDVNDPATVTCAGLALDPRSVLEFQTNTKPHVLTVSGPIEAYGTIRMNVRGSREAQHELRLVGETEEDRTITLQEEGALLVYGNQGLADTERNAVLTVAEMPGDAVGQNGDGAAANGADEQPGDEQDGDAQKQEQEQEQEQEEEAQPRYGAIKANDRTMLDIQNAHVRGLRMTAENIDNTGYVANERLALVANYFTGGSSIRANECDTPLFAKNRFAYEGDERMNASAIYVNESNLPQIRDNHISNYNVGINVYSSPDTMVQDNILVNCSNGILARYRNVMIKGGEIRDCDSGIQTWKGYGIIENVTIRQPRTAGLRIRATFSLEVRNTRVLDTPESADRVNFRGSSITTINCNLTPDTANPELNNKQEHPWIRSWYYMVVRVTGDVPDDAQVMVHTAGFDPSSKQRDANVRNATAVLDGDGVTPRSGPTRVIVVRGWTFNGQMKTDPAPKYVVTVQQPPKEDGEKANVLAKKTVQPDESWFRADLRHAAPNVTIALDE